MPLLNYTTRVASVRTVSQIEQILANHGAIATLKEYDSAGYIEAVSFKIKVLDQELGYRLPVKPTAVMKVLENQSVAPKLRTKEHSVAVAWRVAKDWIEAQMAILETGMVTMDEVFLPYLLAPSGKTLYETLKENRFLLTAGSEEFPR